MLLFKKIEFHNHYNMCNQGANRKMKKKIIKLILIFIFLSTLTLSFTNIVFKLLSNLQLTLSVLKIDLTLLFVPKTIRPNSN